MRYEYPHTIDNGQGEELTFVEVVTDEAGPVLRVSNRVRPGAGPPMHVHHRQRESLTVRSGRCGYQIAGGPKRFAEAGETVTFEAGQMHRFWADGDEDLVCTGQVRPPDNLEYFLTEIYRSTRDNGGRPDDFDAAWLLHRYRSEFDMGGIPGLVRRVVFPVIRLAGRVLGKDRRFADAPAPIGD